MSAGADEMGLNTTANTLQLKLTKFESMWKTFIKFQITSPIIRFSQFYYSRRWLPSGEKDTDA